MSNSEFFGQDVEQDGKLPVKTQGESAFPAGAKAHSAIPFSPAPTPGHNAGSVQQKTNLPAGSKSGGFDQGKTNPVGGPQGSFAQKQSYGK